MITNEALFEKLAEVQALLSMQGKFAGIDEKSVQLWDLQDIADYCKVSYRQAQSIKLNYKFKIDYLLKYYRRENMSELLAMVHENAADLYEAGLMDKKTMKKFDKLCLTPVPTFTPDEIKAIREKEHVSQTVFAHYLSK
ncbi:helix-turn-helix domain-containing protein [Aggregatibacter actinomycetemcomitans]|uniref:helix-turn-helix domain-containing protein n=1 Tax=Aggregatibacter actinomycetemcomitans TaxID=714 RepID=UPI002150E8EC|nr:hypothetical protein [Aggregatibacter actinomycetemcomitans]